MSHRNVGAKHHHYTRISFHLCSVPGKKGEKLGKLLLPSSILCKALEAKAPTDKNPQKMHYHNVERVKFSVNQKWKRSYSRKWMRKWQMVKTKHEIMQESPPFFLIRCKKWSLHVIINTYSLWNTISDESTTHIHIVYVAFHCEHIHYVRMEETSVIWWMLLDLSIRLKARIHYCQRFERVLRWKSE